MTYTPAPACTISTIQSTSTPLTANSSWVPAFESVLSYASISIIINTDVAGTLTAYLSSDGTNVDRTVPLSDGTLTNTNGVHDLIVLSRYFKIGFVNGVTNQTYFRLQVIYNPNPRIAVPTSRLAQSLTNYDDVINTRTALTGQTDSSTNFIPIGATTQGNLGTAILEPVSAFGEVSTAENTPVAQVDFLYGINTNIVSLSTTGSGVTGTVSSAILTVGSGAATSSSSQCQSLRYLKYRPGQGAMGRFTAIFGAPAVGNSQYAGLFTPGMSNGFGVGYTGTSFGFVRISGGTETWYPQSTWNIDVCNGADGATNPSGINLNPQVGNVYQIAYQFLGFGNIFLSIENPATGQFDKVNNLMYANANTATSVLQPCLNMIWRSANSTNNTNITVKGASAGLFTAGPIVQLGPRYCFNNNRTTVTTQELAFTVQNCTSFNGVINRAQLVIQNISFAVSGSSNANTVIGTLIVVKNGTLTGSPSYTPINGTTSNNGATITNGNSIASTDTSATAVTGGTTIYNGVIAQNSTIAYDVSNLGLYMNPGDFLTFAISSTTTCTAGVGIVWNEDL